MQNQVIDKRMGLYPYIFNKTTQENNINIPKKLTRKYPKTAALSGDLIAIKKLNQPEVGEQVLRPNILKPPFNLNNSLARILRAFIFTINSNTQLYLQIYAQFKISVGHGTIKCLNICTI